MSKLGVNFAEPASQGRPRPALGRAILFGAFLGALTYLALHFLGVRL